MFDDDSYYSFKIFEFLLVESNLKDWIIANPSLSTSDFLTCFLLFIGPFIENNCLSPRMKSNALNYLNLVRFNKDEEVDILDDISKNDRIELINSIIRLINSVDCSKYISFYRQEIYKRTSNKKYLTKLNDNILLKNENDLLASIKFDHYVLLSHSSQITKEEFEEEFMPIILSDLRYFKTINCILDEYPKQFENPIFVERYNTVINSFLKIQQNLSGYKNLVLYNRKVASKIRK